MTAHRPPHSFYHLAHVTLAVLTDPEFHQATMEQSLTTTVEELARRLHGSISDPYRAQIAAEFPVAAASASSLITDRVAGQMLRWCPAPVRRLYDHRRSVGDSPKKALNAAAKYLAN